MDPLKTTFHPDVSRQDISPASQLVLIVRHAARGNFIKADSISLLHTQCYDDYSLPGSDLNEGEDDVAGLVRELREETGARGVRNINAFARYDEVDHCNT